METFLNWFPLDLPLIAQNFDRFLVGVRVTLGLTFLSLALGGGLMALTFYSARKGYDDRIEIDTTPDQEQ